MRYKVQNKMRAGLARQAGVSLLELLISTTLGIFFLGVAVQFLVTGQQSVRVQDSGSRIQENARFSLGVLRDDVQLAGYSSNNVLQSPLFYRQNCGAAAGAPATAICSTDTNNLTGDMIAVGFTSDATVNVDCLGTVVPANTLVANVYWVEVNQNNGANSLYCRGWNMTNFNVAGVITPLAAQQPIVDGIDQMQVQYGVTGFLPDGTTPTDQYLSAANVTATNNWANVTSVRIALLVDSGLQTDEADTTANVAYVNAAPQYTLLDGQPITPGDTRLRRIHTTTIVLNNNPIVATAAGI